MVAVEGGGGGGGGGARRGRLSRERGEERIWVREFISILGIGILEFNRLNFFFFTFRPGFK